VEKMLGMDKKGNGFAGRHKPGAAENNNSEPELTEAFLLRHGF
jgi:riboflavin synthase